ncbi:MAG: hypothetical protein U0353_26180 [Sandaracinus sp.]
MASKQVVRRERSTLAVATALDQFGGAIGTGLGTMLTPALEAGEVMPDLTLLTRLLKRTLTSRLQAFVVANAASELEAADDAEPRERRDRLEAELRARVTAARAAVSDLYGTPGLAVYQLSIPPQSGPAPLARYARAVVDALRTPRPDLKPKMATRALVFQASAFADELAPIVDQLDAALADVARERAEAAQATLTRSAALEANDAAFIALAGLVEAMARAAGQHDLANRIRPSTREPGVLVDEPAPPADDAVDPAVTPKPATDPGSPGADPFGT